MLRADLSTVGVSMLLADLEIVFRWTIAGRCQNRCWCLRRWRLPRLGPRFRTRGNRPHCLNTNRRACGGVESRTGYFGSVDRFPHRSIRLIHPDADRSSSSLRCLRHALPRPHRSPPSAAKMSTSRMQIERLADTVVTQAYGCGETGPEATLPRARHRVIAIRQQPDC